MQPPHNSSRAKKQAPRGTTNSVWVAMGFRTQKDLVAAVRLETNKHKLSGQEFYSELIVRLLHGHHDWMAHNNIKPVAFRWGIHPDPTKRGKIGENDCFQCRIADARYPELTDWFPVSAIQAAQGRRQELTDANLDARLTEQYRFIVRPLTQDYRAAHPVCETADCQALTAEVNHEDQFQEFAAWINAQWDADQRRRLITRWYSFDQKHREGWLPDDVKRWIAHQHQRRVKLKAVCRACHCRYHGWIQGEK
jgi:hypothetical protein